MSSSNNNDINLKTPTIDSSIKLNGNLKKHMTYYSLLSQISELIQKIPEFARLKISNTNVIELELVLIACNLIENAIPNGNKLKIDKEQLCCDIFARLFNLTPIETVTLKSQIEYLYNNGMIKKIPYLRKIGKYVLSYFF